MMTGIGVQAVVVSDILRERAEQDLKFGDQSCHPDTLWVAIHGEEFGEVCQAVLSQKPTDADNLYDELVQLAATCMAHAEALRKRGER